MTSRSRAQVATKFVLLLSYCVGYGSSSGITVQMGTYLGSSSGEKFSPVAVSILTQGDGRVAGHLAYTRQSIRGKRIVGILIIMAFDVWAQGWAD